MNKVCYIHIGFHKTGSTAIQRALGQLRQELFSSGITVPETGGMGRGRETVGNHHNVAFQINASPQYNPKKGALPDLIEELRSNPNDTAVISSEAFSFSVQGPKGLSRLREPIVSLGYRVIWIVYVRSFPEWIDSAYSELCKSLVIDSIFSEWIRSTDAYGTAPASHPLVSLKGLMDTGDEILLRSYSCPDVVDDFLCLIGAGDLEVKSPKRANSRVSIYKVEFLRLATVFRKKYLPAGERAKYLRLSEEIARRLPTGPVFSGLSEELAESLRSSNWSEYETLLAKLRPDCEISTFLPSKASYESCTFQNQNLSIEDYDVFYRQVMRLLVGNASVESEYPGVGRVVKKERDPIRAFCKWWSGKGKGNALPPAPLLKPSEELDRLRTVFFLRHGLKRECEYGKARHELESAKLDQKFSCSDQVNHAQRSVAIHQAFVACLLG